MCIVVRSRSALGMRLCAMVALVFVAALGTAGETIKFPKIDRHPAPADYGRGVLDSWPALHPDWGSYDLRGYDLSRLDLRDKYNELMLADFDDVTVWPSADWMPAGFNYDRLMDLGKNPGLKVRDLHAKGIAGKNVGIAIIDQPLLVDHEEYASQLRLYEEINIKATTPAQMHGAAVASIAVGKTLGVAPEADLYYIGAWTGDWLSGGGFDWNFTYYAQGVRRILAINKQLPTDRKIRVICMQVGWNPGQTGYDQISAAVRDAEAAGLMVIDSSTEDTHPDWRFLGLGRYPLDDPQFFASYRPAIWWFDAYLDRPGHFGNYLTAPTDSRATASPTGVDEYVFYRTGGLSWTIPYIGATYALAAQVQPKIDAARFWSTAGSTARRVGFMYNWKKYYLNRVIDPKALIKALKPK
ncbi:MAG: S8 family serine peptidase [Acidobacteriota bacterium]